VKTSELKQIIREEVKDAISEASRSFTYTVTFHADPQTAKGWGIEVSIPAGTKIKVKAGTVYQAAHKALEKLGNPKLGKNYGAPNIVADITRN
jgi:hypothetical protein